MRILMILSNQVGKGSYWRAFYSSQVLAKRGHQVTVMAMSRQSRLRLRETEANGVRLVETPDLLSGSLRSGWDVWDGLRRVLWLKGRSFDLVHAVEARPVVLLPALAAQRRGAKLVMDWCDWLGRGGAVEERPNRLVRSAVRPVETFFEDSFRARADGTVVICSALRQRAIDLGVPPEKILVLADGSNVEQLHPMPQVEARRALGWPTDVPIVGYIGAIFQRDALLMAQAFDHIRKAEPRVQLLVVGYCNVALEKLVDVPEAVRRTGRIRSDEINLYLAACDVCWLPMRDSIANRGRYPLKIKDYMAVGRPVVVTAVGDVADLVRQGEFGVVASDEPADLAIKALSLLRDPSLCAVMGRRARRQAETHHTWGQFVDRLEGFYKLVIEGSPNAI